MKKLYKSLGQIFASVVFGIGFLISQGTCYALYHQPDMPEEMAKKFA